MVLPKIFARRRPRIPYEMFDQGSHHMAARHAKVLERIYHKGHAQAWDGQEVLSALIEEHGVPYLDAEKKEAIGRIFAVILWGELAAWRISAELAEAIEPLEPKMAATSQAFDEARHFYVMYDYLTALDALPDRLHWGAEKLLLGVMNADNLAQKLLGMQLMVEPIALTLFHLVKGLKIEPVLTALLPYYERDESRHVALGIRYLPVLLKTMPRHQRVALWAWQMRLMTYEMWTAVGIAKDLEVLGLDPRDLLRVGKGKQLKAMEMCFESMGIDGSVPQWVMSRYADVLGELSIPDSISLRERLKRACTVLVQGDPTADVDLAPDVTDADVPLAGGMGRLTPRG
jgi:hypothetical protein